MKVLIVDDSASKLDEIKIILESAVASAQIDCAQSFASAVRLLSKTQYELVIVDLMLPIRDGGVAAMEGGKNLMTEISIGVDIYIPNHVICLSEFPEALKEFDDLSNLYLIPCILYDINDNSWQSKLREKAIRVKKRLGYQSNIEVQFNYDLAIITSSPRVELNAVLDLPIEFIPEFNSDDELWYHVAVKEIHGQSFHIVACAAPTMGMTAACATCSKLINRFRPRYVFMAGIAAGTNSDSNYGDIIVADTCYDYGSGKILENADGKRYFTPSPQQIPVSPTIMALLQRWENEQLTMSQIGKSWSAEGTYIPKLKIGVIASGSAVVQSEGLVSEVLANSRKVAGLEMEAYGVFQACSLSSKPKPLVLVAKSVCDFADKHKGDSHQKLAAFTSAHFLYNFFLTEAKILFGNHAGS